MKQWMMIILAFSLVNCTTKEDDDSVSEDLAIAEGADVALSAAADDQSGASMAKAEMDLRELLFPKAYASTCQRPFYDTCQSGVKAEVYEACPLNRGTLNGQAQLDYSDNACSMAVNGNSVTRTYDLTVTGPRGGQFVVSSDTAADYNGNNYGGGETLTKTASGWDLDILGRHKSFITRRGRTAYSVSMRTLQPLEISGGLARSARVVNGGQLEINHNVAGFTATITPSQIEWSGSCCHPISGTLSISYSGARSGSATLEFQGCGTAQLVRAGQTTNLELSYCE